MSAEQIGVVSDVHGNLTAYRAVLDDLERRGVTRVLNLGDVAGKGPRGSACVALTRERCEVTVRGNWDVFLSRPAEERWESSSWWSEELTGEDRAWLAALPNSHDLVLSGRRVRLFHASATSEFHRVHARHTAEQFAGMFVSNDFTGPGPDPTVVGYGDVHDAFVEVVGDRTLFNAGSVGNALDEPSAAYVLLTGVPDADDGPFDLEVVRLDYDVEAEIAGTRSTGMPETDAYAIELRTAIYRSHHRTLGLVAG
ncbi:metallophosphoesterase family protein [Auraticoccus monumenti]|uniref:Predicted phosphodiesterase n=1 Tax=Auraticoccus monumenti TaxID=675864 RepID=A0A1G6WJI3_9ACTN|nr:metallophosphoesterase family protein [Auraticoccus monumenti]SDD65954.1 Predicted phosphodiesterase [Auraticoccus monumenti]